ASFNGDVRSKLPTWSARKGGLLRLVIESPCLFPPDLVRKLDDHPQLRPLLFFRQDIAFLGGRKTALRRQAELIECDIFCRFIDAAFDSFFSPQTAALRRDKAQHELLLALREMPQWLEPAGAVAVVFQEIAVQTCLAKQMLGDEFVAALGDPGRA